jgi:hypothetical protein
MYPSSAGGGQQHNQNIADVPEGSALKDGPQCQFDRLIEPAQRPSTMVRIKRSQSVVQRGQG